MYSLHLTADQREIRDTVRNFGRQEIKRIALKPSRLEAGERRFPPEVLARCATRSSGRTSQATLRSA